MSSVPPPPPSGGGDGDPPAAPPPPSTPPPPPSMPPPSMPPPSMPPPGGAPPPATTAAAAPPARPTDSAKLHGTEQTRTYPCDSCGGELEFDIAGQQLKCPHCGNVQAISREGVRPAEEQDLQTALAGLRSGAVARTVAASADEHEVVCQNCGGHTTFTGSLTATRCPYCATPIQRDDVHDAPDRLVVDGVLPFRVDEKSAKGNIEEWIGSRWFAPNAFKKYSSAGSFRSVYAAYFTYDAHTFTRYTGQRGDNYTVVVGSGENRRTETRIRWTRVSGAVTVNFDDVPILANEGFEPKHVEALEPWPTQDIGGYNPQYVAGHLCRTYDRDVAECFEDARTRMDRGIENAIRSDIGGDHQRISSKDTSWNNLSYKHVLLPIWLLTVLFAGAAYQVFMNGVTGEVHGQRPYSKVKIAFAVLLGLLLVGGVVYYVNSTG